MIGPHASSIATQVVDRQSFGDRADEMLVGHAVGKYRPFAIPGFGIAGGGVGAVPFPAARTFDDSGEEPLEILPGQFDMRVHVLSLADQRR